MGFLLLAALLLRVDGLARPSLETRELHNALLAREYYLGTGAGLPAWKQQVLRELHRSVQPVEPPILDHLAAWEYDLTGGEHLWFPRLLSSLLWVLGGGFLYLLGLRVTTRRGALVALALYLFWPYGVLISRLYMPDPMMVALLLAGALAVVRYWEAPSRRRLAEASAAAAVATLSKPGIAIIFLVALFAAYALSERALRRTLRSGRLPLFAAVAAAPTAAYYLYGTYIQNFLASEGDAGGRFQPGVIVHGWFWRGWWHQLSIMLPFPQQQGILALIPLAAGVAGFVVARAGAPRTILRGLGIGYVAYALALAGYTADNAYYALPLIPILALSIGTLAGFVFERRAVAGLRPIRLATALIVLIAAVGSYKSRPTGVDLVAIADYRHIGADTGHTTNAIIVDERLRTPAMYWGWIVGSIWYQPTAAQDLPTSGSPFPSSIDATRAQYLVVVGGAELRTERRLREITRPLPVVARTDRYAVFDVRGGRLVRSATRSSPRVR